LPPENGQPDSIGNTVTEVSERVTALVREEIELAKAEMRVKAMSIARGAAAGAAGSVFGVFAVLFGLAALAWGINDLVVTGAGNLWIGFVAVFGMLSLFAALAFTFAWRKLSVGAPAPTMALDEAKKIRETVTTPSEGAELVPADTESGVAVATRPEDGGAVTPPADEG
jgi:uncharacterized small protein (DUF1192 family)